MKFIFVDEFKPTSKINNKKLYGISVIMIDEAYYSNYKNGFENAFLKLGWTKDKELKGRYTYSKAVFEDITTDQRIIFAEDLFKLSASKSGKTKKVCVFVCFDLFSDTEKEHDIYTELLSRIFKKIGKPASAKTGKNLIGIFLDSNDSITKKICESKFYELVTNMINKKWIIFEKPIFITSSSLCPGLVFADFVSYFYQNFIDTKRFFDVTKNRFLELLDKEKAQFQDKEEDELNQYIKNYKKQKQSSQIIAILKEIIYAD